MTFCITATTLIIKGHSALQHIAIMLCVVMLLIILMLNDIMLSVVMLNVVILNVFMLTVAWPRNYLQVFDPSSMRPFLGMVSVVLVLN